VIPTQVTNCLKQDEHGSRQHAVKKWIDSVQDSVLEALNKCKFLSSESHVQKQKNRLEKIVSAIHIAHPKDFSGIGSLCRTIEFASTEIPTTHRS
jgi:hypothetical protein